MTESPGILDPSSLQATTYSHTAQEPHTAHQFHRQLEAEDTISNMNTPQRHSYETRFAELTHGPPLINVVPVTSVGAPHTVNGQSFPGNSGNVPFTHDVQQYTRIPRPSTPPQSMDSPMAMAVSPRSASSFTHVQLAAPVTPVGVQRRVVTFGPRANCDRCKMGIKHFIHYDYE